MQSLKEWIGTLPEETSDEILEWFGERLKVLDGPDYDALLAEFF